MTERAIAIGLKIPDNTAYTALVTLRRLGVEVERVERCDVLIFSDGEDGTALRRRVEGDELLFNPNKHRVSVLQRPEPRAGEVWIETIGDERTNGTRPRRYVGWRLFCSGAPASREVLEAAVAALLCNPAIERAIY